MAGRDARGHRAREGRYFPPRPPCGLRRSAPPACIGEVAREVGARLYQRDRDFFVERTDNSWSFRAGDILRAGLPYPALRGDHQLDNAAGALMALEALSETLPVSQAHIRQGLLAAAVPGRFQVLGLPLRVLDVAHNPDAVQRLAQTLRQQTVAGRTLVVFGMLRDKDIAGVARSMRDIIDAWYVTALAATERGATADEIAQAVAQAGVDRPLTRFADARRVRRRAPRRRARRPDRGLWLVLYGR